MLGSTVPATFNLKVSLMSQLTPKNTHLGFNGVETRVPRRRRRPKVVPYLAYHHLQHHSLEPRSVFCRIVLTRVSNDGGGAVDASPQQPTSPDIEELNSSSLGDGYVSLFVRMLGLDNDPLDREQAIVALWKYSLGGKKYVDAIMQFPGCINLTINLLRSESNSTCEAAAGLLRSVSLVNLYKDLVAECGAIEEITGLLSRPSLTPEVKEQSLCTLWNLSVDEKIRVKIANPDILPILFKSLDGEDIKVKEAAGGILANLALSQVNHKIMVELGAIPKLAKLLKNNVEGSKVIRKEARNALLELSKDEYYRILIIEEGLVPVPLIGAAAYKSFRPGLHSWPRLPDGTELERTSKTPSKFGASELLLGLNIDDKNVNIEEVKVNAIIGRTQQQFLARIGAIEMEDGKRESELSSSWQFTLLPWVDGVARLVLILELEDELAISRAAESIADASINEEMRIAFKEAGAVKNLVRLLDSKNQDVKLSVTRALERLSISNGVCQVIEAEDVIDPLIFNLRCPDTSHNLMEKTLDILARILDPSKEMRSKFYDGPVNGLNKGLDEKNSSNFPGGKTGDLAEIDTPKTNTRKNVLDSAVIGPLVEILKTSTPNLQRKAASILEFIAITNPAMDMVISVDIESGLDAIFQQNVLKDKDSDLEGKEPERYALEVEEAGLAISAASRLLTKLLDSQQFCRNIDSSHFTKLLRDILKSSIPFHCKDWIAACLVKLSSLSGPKPFLEDPINMEVTLYETIPRLIEQLKTSSSLKTKEAAAVELNRIISEGVVDSTQAVASEGGIFALVKLIEEGSERAVEAGLAILYNLSMDSENHMEIIAAGAVPVLRRIVLSQRPQWTRALHVLRTLPT
ncbi:Coatomer beta subunit [Trema orientale]|uniref:Coatomer beta subunit n=1 Tax=Trema orientale TaxID=63057 RepID=A0A2P5EPE6_TREOI|nr:Coatomer beta subunit [Trema orientale]